MLEIDFMKAFDHPNIVKFFECYENKQNLYIVEEYLSGGTLEKYLINNMGPIHEDQLRRFMFQALQALNYVHVRGIVHRDIRPDNFMLVRPDSD